MKKKERDRGQDNTLRKVHSVPRVSVSLEESTVEASWGKETAHLGLANILT